MQIGRLIIKLDKKRKKVLGWICPEHGSQSVVMWACSICGRNVGPRFYHANRLVRWILREKR